MICINETQIRNLGKSTESVRLEWEKETKIKIKTSIHTYMCVCVCVYIYIYIIYIYVCVCVGEALYRNMKVRKRYFFSRKGW